MGLNDRVETYRAVAIPSRESICPWNAPQWPMTSVSVNEATPRVYANLFDSGIAVAILRSKCRGMDLNDLTATCRRMGLNDLTTSFNTCVPKQEKIIKRISYGSMGLNDLADTAKR